MIGRPLYCPSISRLALSHLNPLSHYLMSLSTRQALMRVSDSAASSVSCSESALDDLGDLNIHAKHILHKQVNNLLLVSLEVSLDIVHVSLLRAGIIGVLFINSLLQLIKSLTWAQDRKSAKIKRKEYINLL